MMHKKKKSMLKRYSSLSLKKKKKKKETKKERKKERYSSASWEKIGTTLVSKKIWGNILMKYILLLSYIVSYIQENQPTF